MSFSGPEHKRVTCLNPTRSIVVTDRARTGNDVVKLPLGAVQMIRVSGLTGGNAEDFHVERMALVQISREWLASQGLGNLFACAAKLSFWGRPADLRNIF